jgi:hypothetical protein
MSTIKQYEKSYVSSEPRKDKPQEEKMQHLAGICSRLIKNYAKNNLPTAVALQQSMKLATENVV